MHINLFFIQERYFECVITTKEEITRKYEKKVRAEICTAKEWSHGSYLATGGVTSVYANCLADYNDESYIFIECTWRGKNGEGSFLAIDREVLSGDEYHTSDLSCISHKGLCQTILFPKEFFSGFRFELPNGRIVFFKYFDWVERVVTKMGIKWGKVSIGGMKPYEIMDISPRILDFINLTVDDVPFLEGDYKTLASQDEYSEFRDKLIETAKELGLRS